MSGAREATILFVSLALAAFTFGCTSDSGAGGAGGTGGAGGAGGGAGEGGMGGEGGAGGEAGLSIEDKFETSLHNTRAGKDFWYSAEHNGFESLTAVPFEDLTCLNCHNTRDPAWEENGNMPSCFDCHDSGMGGADGIGGMGGMPLAKHLNPATCLGCHGRQGLEVGMIEGRDVHAMSYGCADCHGDRDPDPNVVDANDVHGNGIPYDTARRPGAIAARCTDCHGEGVDDAPDPPDDAFHAEDPHGVLDCALCHTETVVTCVNCHLEDSLDNQQDCRSGTIFNWKFVMKWDKEGDGNEVYHPATMMTLKYNCDREAGQPECPDEETDPKKTFAVFAPYYAHTVTEQAIENVKAAGSGPFPDTPENEGCGYCHTAANCETILAADVDNPQKLIQFSGGMLTNPISGLIPLDEDYQNRYEIDFVEWEAGAGTGCPTPDMPKSLVLFEEGPDLWQTGEDTGADNPLELGRPLTAEEFANFCPSN